MDNSTRRTESPSLSESFENISGSVKPKSFTPQRMPDTRRNLEKLELHIQFGRDASRE